MRTEAGPGHTLLCTYALSDGMNDAQLAVRQNMALLTQPGGALSTTHRKNERGGCVHKPY